MLPERKCSNHNAAKLVTQVVVPCGTCSDCGACGGEQIMGEDRKIDETIVEMHVHRLHVGGRRHELSLAHWSKDIENGFIGIILWFVQQLWNQRWAFKPVSFWISFLSCCEGGVLY